MKKMMIFEPAMCCPTGLCGVGVDSELLRISTALDTLRKHGIVVERYNLSNSPMEFVNRSYVHGILQEKGVEALPITVVDDEVKLTSRYPSNTEICELLALSLTILSPKTAAVTLNLKKANACCSPDSNCCSTDEATTGNSKKTEHSTISNGKCCE